jgi:hypothetical protein
MASASRRARSLYQRLIRTGSISRRTRQGVVVRSVSPLLFLGCYRSEDAAGSPCLQALLEAREPGETVGWSELAVEPLTPL